MFSRSAVPTTSPKTTAERRWSRCERPGQGGRTVRDKASCRPLSALAYAARCHLGQRRESDGAPFVEHHAAAAPPPTGELADEAGASGRASVLTRPPNTSVTTSSATGRCVWRNIARVSRCCSTQRRDTASSGGSPRTSPAARSPFADRTTSRRYDRHPPLRPQPARGSPPRARRRPPHGPPGPVPSRCARVTVWPILCPLPRRSGAP